ncbi:MAG: hypothetical protein RSG58_07540, partial [Eubacterium sp.]
MPAGKVAKQAEVQKSAVNKLSTDLGTGLYKVTVAASKITKVEYLKNGHLITITYTANSNTGDVTIEKTDKTTI